MDEEILRRLDSIEGRLDRLERLAGMAPQPSRPAMAGAPHTAPEPPPVVRHLVPPHISEQPQAPPQPQAKAVASLDLEYQIGAKIGPIVGAIAFIAGIFYLVSLGLTRGWITREMLFFGACILCGAFIAVGLWKREEKEEFGQILTGIGSCGLYLNFAAGHVYQKLYEGEVLVGLFVALSLLNLVYAWWRSSRAFLSIGLLGGLAAALMPLDQQKVETSLLLNLLIIVPSVLIAAKNRWAKACVAIYGASMLTYLAIPDPVGRIPLVLAIYATSLLACTAFVWSEQEFADFDPTRCLVALLVFLGGLYAFPLQPDLRGASYVLLYGAIAVSAGFMWREKKHARPMMLGGVLTALVLAPFGWGHIETIWIFVGLAALLALGSMRWEPKVASSLSGVALAFAFWAYSAAAVLEPLTANQETAVLAAFIAAMVLSTYAAVRAWRNTEALVLGTSILLVPPSVRFVQLVVTPLFESSIGTGVTFGLMVYGALLVGATYFLRSSRMALVTAAVLAVGLVLYVATFEDRSTSVALDVYMVAFFALVVGLCALVAADRAIPDSKTVLTAFASVVIGCLVSRIGYLLLSGHMPEASAALLGGAGYTLLLSSYAFGRRTPGLPVGMGVLWMILTFLYASLHEAEAPFGSWEVWVLLALLAVLPLITIDLQREEEFPPLYYAAALGGWFIGGRLGSILLGQGGLGMNDNAAITTAWTATALILMTVGFVREIVHLRFAAFGVLFTTALKIVFVDLANTDQAVKVLILMFLGLVMLGGGYWYIRREGRTPRAKA